MSEQTKDRAPEMNPGTTSPEVPVPSKPSRFKELASNRSLALVPVLLVALVVGFAVSSVFLTQRNIINLLQQSSELSIVVVALSLVLISGKFDLSLESTFALAPMVGAFLILPTAVGGSGLNLPPVFGIIITLAVGMLIGAINGFFVIRLELNAFIVTIAMLILLRGITLGLVSGRTLFELPESFLYLGQGKIIGVPVSLWVAGLIFVLAALFLRYHSIGRAIYAIGGNAEAARAAGISVARIQWSVFIVAGGLAALGGLALAGRTASVTPSQGTNLIFSAFAAAVIGGISLNGGRGTMLGAFLGVLLLAVITNILTLSQIPSFWIDATNGAIILMAILISRFTAGKEAVD
jgi:simple sugar transport system permease protein